MQSLFLKYKIYTLNIKTYIYIKLHHRRKVGNGDYLSKLTACKARQNATNNKHKIAAVKTHIHYIHRVWR